MSLDNILNKLSMGGYGVYVWMSFFAFIVIFIGLWVVPYYQLKKQAKK